MNHDVILIVIWSIILLIAIVNLVLALKKPKKYDGAIKVNNHDPEKDMYTLELYIPFGTLENCKSVTFEILHE